MTARDEQPDAETLAYLKEHATGVRFGFRWHKHPRPKDAGGRLVSIPICDQCKAPQVAGRSETERLHLQLVRKPVPGGSASEYHYLGQCHNCKTIHWVNAGIPLHLAAFFSAPEPPGYD